MNQKARKTDMKIIWALFLTFLMLTLGCVDATTTFKTTAEQKRDGTIVATADAGVHAEFEIPAWAVLQLKAAVPAKNVPGE
jgi:hypothetical protein